MSAAASGTGGSTRPWLVVIDLQHVFADAGSPWQVPGFAAVLPRVHELVATHRGRTVLTRFVPPEQPWGSWIDYYRDWPFALEPGHPEQWDLVPGLAGGAPVVSRPTMGKWGDELLAATGGATDLVLCGVSTDCCVLSTALAAADAGARVRVESAACAGSSTEAHERALAAMGLYAPQVEVV